MLEQPIEILNTEQAIIEKIKNQTNCKFIKDLWSLSPKEICNQLGLNKNEIEMLLVTMKEIAIKQDSIRYIKYIEQCEIIFNRGFK
ncbi:MAG: hypothetical protein MJ133_07665 [Lachnospiraceae bacterium]|nr:hypothetical protein [Lachnospiraceae bacterium]